MRTFRTPEEVEQVRERFWAEHSYTFGAWAFCYPNRMARWAGGEARLTEMEADMLKVLLDAFPEPLSARALAVRYEQVSGNAFDHYGVKVYVARIRRKLGAGVILTSGPGYVFNSAIGFA